MILCEQLRQQRISVAQRSAIGLMTQPPGRCGHFHLECCCNPVSGSQRMDRSYVIGLLAGGIALMSVTQAIGQQTCRPALAVKQTRFPEMKPPTLERKWTAVLSVDASRCATTSGRFEIVFSRLKEIGTEIEFREQFR